MKLHVQSIHFDADRKLLSFIQEKVEKLRLFYDHILGGDVFLRLDRAGNLQNKVVHIHILVPGQELHAREQCRTFEEATDLAVESLSRQIIRHKQRQRGE
jgi:putative sigma-54 modulation protein